VALLEASRVAAGASGRSGGQVHTGQRPGQRWLEQAVGKDDARRLFAFGEEAKALVRVLAARDPDGCFLRFGLIGAAHTAGALDELRSDAEHLAAAYGYDDEELLDRDALAAAIGSRRYVGGLRDGGAFHLDPYRLALATANAAEEAGAAIFEASRAERIARGGGRLRVRTAAGPVLDAETVVVAANGYLGHLEPRIAARVMPINNFIGATAPLSEALFARLIPGGEGVFDTRFVIRYWRPTADRRIAFGGGESTGARWPSDVAALVRRYLLEIYPQLSQVPLDHAWGGTLAITPTRFPYVRRLEPGLYAACGFSGQGVGTAPFVGKILADAIAEETGAFDIFSRVPVPRFPGGTRLRAPLLATVLWWYGLRDRLGV
jgi:gamma-glutamylputrescine oxidase